MKTTNAIWGLCMLVFLGCSDLSDIRDVEIKKGDPEFAIPVAYSSITLESIFENAETEETNLIIYPDSSISLEYSGDVLMQSADDLFPPIYGFIPIVVQNKEDTIALPVQRLELLDANLRGDSLIIYGESSWEEDINLHVEILSLSLNGEVVTFDIPLNYTGEKPVTNAEIVSMSGMDLDLYENSLIVHYSATNSMGEEVDIDFVQILWNEMTFHYVEGYFSKNEVNIPGDFIDIEVYDRWINGRLYFEDPIVEVSVDNAFGFPVRAEINKLRFIGRQGEIVDLESPQNDSINFNYPGLHEVGQVKQNLVVYDGDNSNIEDIINVQPIRLEYDIDAIGNPDEDPTIIGFFTDSSFIRINVRVELPVRGWANNFTARDTLDFEVGNLEEVETAEFKIVFDNGMPLDLTSQLYLLNEQGMVIDSMFGQEALTIYSSQVDAQGNAIGKERTEHYEPFDRARLDRLENVKSAILEASFLTNGAPSQSVSIDAYDQLDMRVGLKVNLQ